MTIIYPISGGKGFCVIEAPPWHERPGQIENGQVDPAELKMFVSGALPFPFPSY